MRHTRFEEIDYPKSIDFGIIAEPCVKPNDFTPSSILLTILNLISL